MLKLIADIFGTAGMAFFLWAEVRQLIKIKRTKMSHGISFHAYKNKMTACILTLVCFAISGLWFSFAVIFAELVVITPIMKFLWGEKCKRK